MPEHATASTRAPGGSSGVAIAWADVFSRGTGACRPHGGVRSGGVTPTLPRKAGHALHVLRRAHEGEHVAMSAFVRRPPFLSAMSKVSRYRTVDTVVVFFSRVSRGVGSVAADGVR
jgi:hypothetical protein